MKRAIVLHGNRQSASTQPVLWYCHVAGIEVELVQVGKQFGGNDTPEYRRLNPNGLVPTLVDGDHVLWESTAILRYLACARGERLLYPADLRRQSLCDQWMTWHISTYVPAMRPLFIEVVRNQGRNADAVARETVRCNAVVAILDEQLGRSRYLAGDEMTLADLCLVAGAHRWFSAPFARDPSPSHQRWYEEMKREEPFAAFVDVGFG
jgi:glutathione S-transferase